MARKPPDPVSRKNDKTRHRSSDGLFLAAIFGFFAFCFFKRRARPRGAAPPPAEKPAGALQPGHETKDASAGWIFVIVAILGLSGIAIHLLLGGYLHQLNATAAPGDDWQTVSHPAGGFIAPMRNYPLLQVSPPFDLAAFRAREEARLNSYGWVDKASGRVHIPITNAMDLLLSRGLPVSEPDNRGPSSYEMQIQRVEQQAPVKEKK